MMPRPIDLNAAVMNLARVSAVYDVMATPGRSLRVAPAYCTSTFSCHTLSNIAF